MSPMQWDSTANIWLTEDVRMLELQSPVSRRGIKYDPSPPPFSNKPSDGEKMMGVCPMSPVESWLKPVLLNAGSMNVLIGSNVNAPGIIISSDNASNAANSILVFLITDLTSAII